MEKATKKEGPPNMQTWLSSLCVIRLCNSTGAYLIQNDQPKFRRPLAGWNLTLRPSMSVHDKFGYSRR